MTTDDPRSLVSRVETLEDQLQAMSAQTNANFTAVIANGAAIRRELREGFASTDGRFDELKERFDALEQRLGSSVTTLQQTMARNQAQILKLLAGLAGQDPDGDH